MKPTTILLLFGGISGAFAENIQVFLYPPPAAQFTDVVTLREARVALGHHLGLEYFETLGSLQAPQENFVGVGQGNAVVVALSEGDVKDVVPEFMGPSFSFDSSLSVTRMLSKYTQRASHIYSHIFTSSASQTEDGPHRILDMFDLSPTPASNAFKQEASLMMKFYDSDADEKFGVFRITSLKSMADQYGEDSEEYQLAKTTFSAILSGLDQHNTKVAILAYPSSSLLRKRQQPPQSPLPLPSPAEPISAISTCYASSDACQDATDSCTGHGQCVAATKAGRTCYVCACTFTRSTDGQGRNKTQNWAGNACERLDVSGPFVLLTGTAIALILLVVGSISLLGGVGGQELPSTLTGGLGGASKKD